MSAFTRLNLFGVGLTAVTASFALWIYFRDYEALDGKYADMDPI